MVMGELRDTLFTWGQNVSLLDGSQATPASLSDKGSMKVKASEWLEVVARDKRHGI
jgi:hypothetical protein